MLEKISKPYLVRVTDKAREAGFVDERFPNKVTAMEYVSRVKLADPDFNPSVSVVFRYFDYSTGELYVTRLEYEREQERRRQWQRSNDKSNAKAN